MKVTFTGIIPLPLGEEPDPAIIYTLDNVPFPPLNDPRKAPGGLRPPQTGITLIHGQRIGMVALAQIRAMLVAANLQAIPISVEVESVVGAKTLYRSEDLANVNVLHLDRLSAELRDEVIDHLDCYARQEGMPYPWPEKRRACDADEIIMSRPHLIAYLLQEEQFKHLQVICYPVKTGGTITRRGTIFDCQAISRIYSMYYPGISISLPGWLQ